MTRLIVHNYTVRDFLSEYDLLAENRRILNAGSASTRFGSNCVNVDIQPKPGVDVVCDVQRLPPSIGRFDAIICAAMLQYCATPDAVAREFYRTLKPGGYLFVDAPWVQAACPDTPDRFRFSADALRTIFAQHFEILKIGPSIRPGSALAMTGVQVAGSLTRNRYINFALRQVATAALLPLSRLRTTDESATAGAFYLVGQRPTLNRKSRSNDSVQ